MCHSIWEARLAWARRCRERGATYHRPVKRMTRVRSEPVEIPGLDVARAKRYSRRKLAVLLLSTLWSVVRLAWFASDRRAARLNASIAGRVPDRRLAAPAFFTATMALSWLSSLPVAYAGNYQVERRFGLTKQSTGGWLGDQVM